MGYAEEGAIEMRGTDQATLELFVSRVRGRFPAAEIWAYGSRVRGDATAESDLDICVVLDRLHREVETAATPTFSRLGSFPQLLDSRRDLGGIRFLEVLHHGPYP